MSNPDVPNFGVLLAPAIAALPEAARPAMLCGLERAAAARYRAWAEELPDHKAALLACAEREDEIANSVAGLFPLDAAGRQAVDKALPEAIAIYHDAFAPHPVLEQLYLQSEAELQGAAAWANIAKAFESGTETDTLARCSALEEENSRAAKEVLATIG
jgi:hypothetical protein